MKGRSAPRLQPAGAPGRKVVAAQPELIQANLRSLRPARCRRAVIVTRYGSQHACWQRSSHCVVFLIVNAFFSSVSVGDYFHPTTLKGCKLYLQPLALCKRCAQTSKEIFTAICTARAICQSSESSKLSTTPRPRTTALFLRFACGCCCVTLFNLIFWPGVPCGARTVTNNQTECCCRNMITWLRLDSVGKLTLEN